MRPEQTGRSLLSKSPSTVRLHAGFTLHFINEEAGMKYLCLIYGDESARARVPEAAVASMSNEYREFTNGIRESGHYVGGDALHPTSAATTVRVRNGKIGATDGPFAETAEQLAGYYVVEAADLNDAIQVAARIPGAKSGSIEVRPILAMS
jgi:hypothetical protein